MNAWGYLNLGKICFEFSGGTLEQQSYLKSFYLSLQNTPCSEQKIKVEITSEESDNHSSDNLIAVVMDKYYIGEHRFSFRQYSPTSWIILTNGNFQISVVTFKNWELTKDILNQALRDAIYRVCKMNDMHVAHAACVLCTWGTALLFGGSGVGKSTLAIALGSLGHDVISDDKCIITDNKIITSLGFPITFRAGTSALIPALKKYEANLPEEVFTNDELRYKHKIAIDYDSLVGKNRTYTQQSEYHVIFLQRTDAENAQWIYKNSATYETLLSQYNNEIDSMNPMKLISNAKTVHEFLLPHSTSDEYRMTLDVFKRGPKS